MNAEREEAEEHLRVIRSLMERATVYRAISAPTALVAGVAALAVSTLLLYRAGDGDMDVALTAGFTRDQFLPAWLCALVITVAANTIFLWREAQRDGREFLSAGLRLALRSIIPSFFVAGMVTFIIWRDPFNNLDAPYILGLTWTACYGLALLSTMNFAPRSLSILGWSFVVSAVIWLLLLSSPNLRGLDALRGISGATLPLALTFGIFHLVYAACTWPARGAAKREQLTPSE
ncbi:hypothetical protein BH20VER1_BH20VER1_09380 [soil metagenome]